MTYEGSAMPKQARWSLAALWAIIGITVAWWALALWPLPSETTPWLARAREICFGSAPDGLPHAGGWVLLIGEPLGMIGFLMLGWGSRVREGIRALLNGSLGRLALAGTAGFLAIGVLAAGSRVAQARGEPFDIDSAATPTTRLMELGEPAPELGLVNQHGDRVSIASLHDRPVLVAFAYAHCETVCPLLVRQVIAAAREAAVLDPAIVVLTLDPWRDTPSRLGAIAEAWGLPENAHVLSGDPAEVEAVLNRWKVPRVRNASTGEVIHPSVVYVLTRDGRIAYLTDGHPALLREGLSRVTQSG